MSKVMVGERVGLKKMSKEQLVMEYKAFKKFIAENGSTIESIEKPELKFAFRRWGAVEREINRNHGGLFRSDIEDAVSIK